MLELPPGVRLTIEGITIPLDGAEALGERVARYNAARHLEVLPDELNTYCLQATEVLAFVRGLGQLPPETAERVCGQTIDLTDRGLRLFALDGLGQYGLAQPFDLVFANESWWVQPYINPWDAAVELGTALRHMNACNEEEAARWPGGTMPAPVDPRQGLPQGYAPSGRPAVSRKTQYAYGAVATAAQVALTLAPLQVDGQVWDQQRLQQLVTWMGQRIQDGPAHG